MVLSTKTTWLYYCIHQFSQWLEWTMTAHSLDIHLGRIDILQYTRIIPVSNQPAVEKSCIQERVVIGEKIARKNMDWDIIRFLGFLLWVLFPSLSYAMKWQTLIRLPWVLPWFQHCQQFFFSVTCKSSFHVPSTTSLLPIEPSILL